MSDDKKDTKKKTAIDAPRGTHFMVDPDDLTIVGLDTVDGADHPLYDVRILKPLDDAKIRNFRAYGVIKPIRAKKDGGKLIVVDGRGRTRYARAVKQLQIAAGEETIRVPVLLVAGDDSHLWGYSRAANLHDADGPLTTAKNAQKLLDMGKTLPEVADTFGVSEQTIRNWQAMLNLAPEVLDAVIKQELTATAATALAVLPQTEQKEVLAEVKKEAEESGTKPTVERVKAKANEKAGKSPTQTPKAKIDRCKVIMLKLAASPTKDDLYNTLDRVCRILHGVSLEKLGADE